MINEINIRDEDTIRPVEARQASETTREIESKDMGELATSVTNKKSTIFGASNLDELRSRWNSIQAQFVDQPRASIGQADTLIAEILQKISQQLTNEHNNLRNRWQDHDDASTEDLRLALQDYRSFFNNLLKE